MVDLRLKDRNNICILAEKSFSSPIEILAYGSRVNGDNHEASDLDLVVRGKNDESIKFNELFEFKEQLQQSNIPIFIQVMDWSRIPKYFHENILKRNEILYSNLNNN